MEGGTPGGEGSELVGAHQPGIAGNGSKGFGKRGIGCATDVAGWGGGALHELGFAAQDLAVILLRLLGATGTGVTCHGGAMLLGAAGLPRHAFGGAMRAGGFLAAHVVGPLFVLLAAL